MKAFFTKSLSLGRHLLESHRSAGGEEGRKDAGGAPCAGHSFTTGETHRSDSDWFA